MNSEQAFFNQLAQRWDDLRCADDNKIAALVAMIGINTGDTVLDVGCGTGILLPFLKKVLGETGNITAIDFAANMITRAAAKHRHLSGITYVTGDILDYQPPQAFDKIICFNFFPHVKDKTAFLAKMKSMLKTGGILVIMHDLSRQAVNAIHAGNTTVQDDRLPPSDIVAQMLQQADFSVLAAVDNNDYYFIKATVNK